MFAALYAKMVAENVQFQQRMAEARRETKQYAQFPDALRGAIVGAPADPEAFG